MNGLPFLWLREQGKSYGVNDELRMHAGEYGRLIGSRCLTNRLSKAESWWEREWNSCEVHGHLLIILIHLPIVIFSTIMITTITVIIIILLILVSSTVFYSIYVIFMTVSTIMFIPIIIPSISAITTTTTVLLIFTMWVKVSNIKTFFTFTSLHTCVFVLTIYTVAVSITLGLC